MTATLEYACGELAPTATCTRRSWQWLPAHGHELDGRDGTLVILMTSGRRRIKTEFFYYTVQVEWDEFLDEGVWSFLLENERSPDLYGPYRCIVGSGVSWCSCTAGWFDERRPRPTSCKHRDALAAIVNEGVFG